MSSQLAAASRFSMSRIEKRFGATTALAGVDLGVSAGEAHALIGENGAGKSTLMKILAGALAPDAGSMELDGAGYAPRTPHHGRAAGVAMIFQELSLAPHLTVAENILLGAEPARAGWISRSRSRQLARAALERVGRSDLDLDLCASRLSIADQQLVEIARSLAVDARVFVFDEPTSSLGVRDVERLFELIRRLKAGGAAIVYISHALEEVLELCDRYTVLRDGRSVASGDVAGASVHELVRAMVGREVDELYPRSLCEAGESIASARDLAGQRLPIDASLEIRRGEVLGLAGLIGAGRTELLRALFGLDRVARGELSILGLAGARAPHERWRQGVGFASEDRKREGLALSLSIADNLCLPSLERLSRAGFVAPRRVERAAQHWIDALRIRCASPRQAVQSLSGGNQQKVALARLLLADVDLLLLDEPTRGIDVGSKAEIYALIDRLARASDGPRKAIVMISSYLPELLGVCDRVAVMCRGRLGPARPVGELDEHSIMLQATGSAA